MDRTRLALFLLPIAIGPALASCSGPSHRLRADDRPPTSGRPSAEGLAARVEDVVARHNAVRTKAKLNRLEVSPRLTKAAQWQADDMAGRRKMSHKGSDGSTPFDRIERAGYRYRRAGENVAYGFFNSERLMQGWMDSPPHKRNILGGFSQVGVAYATDEVGTTYWCVTFGLPKEGRFSSPGEQAGYP